MELSSPMDMDRARALYEQVQFTEDADALALAEQELDSAEADVALARGRILHTKFLRERVEDPREFELFTRAAELYRGLGDSRAEAEALFWVGIVHQVVRGDHDAGLPYFERSYHLATAAGDKMIMSYAVRHLAFVARAAGRSDEARAQFEESLRLRREIGFLPGVAAALLALGECVGDTSMLNEAASVARECGATAVLGWVEQTRAAMS
ncbi:tetratricopeptide repeat protein [Actinocrispum wychmicini]|uniref:Tetratricopeptide repeat protein n=1 Tax=Actinocrispum wychmicini TaxID=1213861 RepID=A0A4R2JCJ2_9PSEU|nr:tetratricopeptide repeat protein [Actinocrispum wychmicini]TCO57291.1 tetratricopeptide repeat protein [Actinocrispum wychmicini]